MKRNLLHAASLVILITGLPPLQATVILTDVAPTGAGGYTAQNPYSSSASRLFGQNPSATTGFTGAWGPATSDTLYANSSNLGVSGIPDNTGGSLGIRYSATGTGDGTTRSNSRGVTPYSSTSALWTAAVMQANTAFLGSQSSTSQGFLGFLDSSLTSTQIWNGGNGGGFAFGIEGTGSGTGALTLRYQADAGGAGAVTDHNFSMTLTAGTDYIWLSQLLFNTDGENDTLNLWLLTSIPANEADLGAPSVSVQGDIFSDSTDIAAMALFLRTSGSGGTAQSGNTLLFDGIRIGTQITDVVTINPVPEPSVSVMLGLCVAGVLLIRRYRSKSA